MGHVPNQTITDTNYDSPPTPSPTADATILAAASFHPAPNHLLGRLDTLQSFLFITHSKKPKAHSRTAILADRKINRRGSKEAIGTSFGRIPSPHFRLDATIGNWTTGGVLPTHSSQRFGTQAFGPSTNKADAIASALSPISITFEY